MRGNGFINSGNSCMGLGQMQAVVPSAALTACLDGGFLGAIAFWTPDRELFSLDGLSGKGLERNRMVRTASSVSGRCYRQDSNYIQAAFFDHRHTRRSESQARFLDLSITASRSDDAA